VTIDDVARLAARLALRLERDGATRADAKRVALGLARAHLERHAGTRKGCPFCVAEAAARPELRWA
jgi:hypothetical protein